ncbi:Aldo-keto reductase family 1 member [Wickerhamomyces ciferrii]|uniref:Aldo-keto reductase family 1 member n=1 Tax=Wickerhamomyces ciferrii (strain ATCC 14091 / BCRC 22168 / CBS 111 / JCM 3599 / NBRC 0793 / NRRL Y-1031 F-60-10) TaxID=1206466 RepID=K0KP06_WICCF|nr:Aldo-keto reductase family 1 member [Wickerhamomyces ciferrii]CCH42838.1 Aldo-keto reductase family 1 member [Wickerhamomyces ciferrii]
MTHQATTTYTLNSGAQIPALALGTWQATDQQVYESVVHALQKGYRHIDTAAAYGNEEPIGRAIRDSGVKRDELFVTTKLWSSNHNDPESAIRKSLELLGLDYVDLYLIHWPVALNPNGNHPIVPTKPDGSRDIILDWPFTKTYKLLEPLVEKGYTKSIGVCNVTISKLDQLLSSSDIKIKPSVLQVELHPYLPQHKLVKYAQDHGLVVEAYSPLGSSNSPLLKDEDIQTIANKYDNASIATILVSWAIWRKTVVLAKSVNPLRIESNSQIVDLGDEDGEFLNNFAEIKGGIKRFVDPNWSPVVIFDTNE